MTERVTPHQPDAEAAVLGACILDRNALATAVGFLEPADFMGEANPTLFAAIVAMWQEGEPIDTMTLLNRLKRDGTLDGAGGPFRVTEVQSLTPSTSNVAHYCRLVANAAAARRLIGAGSYITDLGYETLDVGDALDAARSALDGVQAPLSAAPGDLWSVDDFLDRPGQERSPWVVNGLLRRDWRVLIVAPEGVGKSQLYRQFALCSAQGIHPLAFTDMPKVRTLLVDFENPDDAVVEGCQPIRDQLKRVVDYEPDRAWLWHRPGGVNLRTRAGRGQFEAVLAHVKPDLVCLGPLYKAYRRAPNENDEAASDHVQGILDELRTRYRFALLLEHHAPKKQAGVRDIEPYGSSYWLRWPEIGLGLLPEDEKNMELRIKRWRGDRLPNSWPDSLHRAKPWPWEGRWPKGVIREGVA